METAALESSLSTLNIALNFAIGAVVLGLILEYAPEFWSKLSRRPHKWIEKSGEILVILGVAGELLLHVRSEQIDDQIKSLQRAGLAQLFDRATAAEKAAAEAKLELAKMSADRVLTESQISELVKILRPFAGSTFWVATEKGKEDVDSEQELLAKQLMRVFSSAGWKKEIHWSAIDRTKEDPEFIEVSNRGCQIDFAGDPKSTILGNLVTNSLKADGIECKTFAGAEILPNHVIITVGLR